MLPKTRKEAIEHNSRYFFTGKPCRNGHVARRSTVNGSCEACKLQWQRENKEKIRLSCLAWQKANPERVACYVKRWQKANPDYVREAQKRHYEKHRQVILSRAKYKSVITNLYISLVTHDHRSRQDPHSIPRSLPQKPISERLGCKMSDFIKKLPENTTKLKIKDLDANPDMLYHHTNIEGS